MRKIKFRGKATRDYPALKIKKGDWVYGYLADENLISVDIYMDDYGDLHCVLVEVDPKTVGQYATVDDKNGREIYEGDIIKIAPSYHRLGEIYVVKFGRVEIEAGECENVYENIVEAVGAEIIGFYAESEFEEVVSFVELADVEVIGNVYDNPELLEGKDD